MIINKIKKMLLSLVVVTMTLGMVGCGSNEETFTIAYLPNESTEQKADARNGLAEGLSKELGMKVVEYQASDYNAIIESMRTGKVDMAYFGPLSFCLAYDKANAEPIVMKAKNGDKSTSTYKSVLIANKDSDIKTIKDIKGRTMAFVEPNSTSGALIPAAEIINSFSDFNLTIDDLQTNGKFFQSVSFSGKHQAGLQAVLKGDIDVAPISDQILANEIKHGNAPKNGVKIIHESAPIPSEPMAVRGDLPKEVKDKVKNFLVNYNNESYFDTLFGDPTMRFIQCSIEDYKDIIELNKKINN